MKNTRFKQAYNAVLPDAYMESRLWENIKDKKKKRFPFKAVISCALAFAVVAAGAGGIYYKNTFTDRPFSVMVVSASDEITNRAELSESAVAMPQIKIDSYAGSDGSSVVTTDYATGGFAVKGDDIDYIQYKSKNGYFLYYDDLKRIYDTVNGNYYTAVIPVSDDDAEKINDFLNEIGDDYVLNTENSALENYMKTHDLSEYFGKSGIDLSDYSVEFSKCSDIIGYESEPGYAFFVVDYEKDNTYRSGTGPMFDGMDTLTVQTYDIPQDELQKFYTEEDILNLSSVYYQPEKAVDTLLADPDTDKSELPVDEVTITVTFQDGKKARKTVNVSFDKDGVAQFVMK